nr:N-acetylmuramoyl-L-alanine amidase [Clostridium sp. E14]
MYIESPGSGITASNNVTIYGWALNASGVKEANVMLDNQTIGKAILRQDRPDVNKAFSGYQPAVSYTFDLDVKKYSSGSHNVTVEVVGNDLSKDTRNITININKLEPKMWIETPNSGLKANKNFVLYGWSLNPSGVKEANILVNNKVIGKAQLRQDRPDVNNAFPGYPSAVSFTYEFDINQVPMGACNVTVNIIGNDGSEDSRQLSVNIEKPAPRMWVETPNSGMKTSRNVTIYGWALNASGIRDANVKIDGAVVGNPTISKDRPDVNNAFPGYQSAVSFSYELNIDTVDAGYRNVTIEVFGNDGSVDSRTIGIDVTKLVPKTWIESLGSSVKTSQTTRIYGWAINPTGVSKANIILDNNIIGQAVIRQDRPDVNNAYPAYPSAVSFTYDLDVSKYPIGNHILKVEILGNDGSKDVRNVDLTILKEMREWIEYPYANALVKSKFTVAGWALSPSPIKSINVYIDGSLKGYGNISGDRPDVNNAIPGYPMAKGYDYTVDITSERPGVHALTVEITNEDGDKVTKSVFVTKNIVYAIDIGHNVIYDGGATYKTSNGTVRIEDKYNMEVGTRVISILESMGYEVVNVLPKTATSVRDSLKQRTDKANAANADMYVCIHFNVGGGHGTEVYYDSDEGKKIAQDVLNNIVGLGYYNRGVKSNDYYVLVNTKAPAILIENAFLDSEEDMARYNPDDLAKAIVNGIKR